MVMGCHTPRAHTNKFLLRCTLGASHANKMGRCKCCEACAKSTCSLVVVMAKHTLDTLMVVFTWSMQIMLGGHFPTKKHDGTPLDKFRAEVSKLPFLFASVILQVRGDWQFYNECLGFPAWDALQLCSFVGCAGPARMGVFLAIGHNLHHGG